MISYIYKAYFKYCGTKNLRFIFCDNSLKRFFDMKGKNFLRLGNQQIIL